MEKIVIVSGIPTETSRLGGVLKGWEHLLRDEGHQVDWIHVRASARGFDPLPF